MRKSLIGASAGLFLVALAFLPNVPAQTPKSAGTGMAHDIAGVWNGDLGAAPSARGAQPPRAQAGPVMLPEAQARFDANTSEARLGMPMTKDPAYNCLPPGLPHVFSQGAFPFEIVQTPKRIFMFFEAGHHWREIWMDGREIPKDGDPTWMGYSVGHWEADTLIVESGNFNDITWLDSAGHPHSDQLKITETYRRVGDRLQMSTTINDPKFYKQPWTTTRTVRQQPSWEIGEDYCISQEQSSFENQILAPAVKTTPAK